MPVVFSDPSGMNAPDLILGKVGEWANKLYLVAEVTSAASSSSSTANGIASNAATATATDCADLSSGSSTNSTAIGVGVGIGAAALLAVGSLGYLYSREHKRFKALQKQVGTNTSGQMPGFGIEGGVLTDGYYAASKTDTPLQEAAASGGSVELEARRGLWELAG